MKPYYQHTEAERVKLTEDEIFLAIKLEAIERGIKVPLPVPELLKVTGYSGFSIPPDSHKLYEIYAPGSYDSTYRSGLCFNTEAEAVNALTGAIPVYEDGYGASARYKIASGQFSIRAIYISRSGAKSFQQRIDETDCDAVSEDFEKLAEECAKDVARIRQSAYDKSIRTYKRVEYLKLAQGNEAIAAAFWAKVESGEFPSE